MGPDATRAYSFRPVREADLPLLASWLREPHVEEWWDNHGVEDIRMVMASAAMEAYLVALQGEPIGYIQHYAPHLEDGHPYRDQPNGTLGIDQFIGPPRLVGIGHGSRALGIYVEGLFGRGAPRVVIDPDPANTRAIRAYTKAGFIELDRRTSIYGDAILMRRDAPALERS